MLGLTAADIEYNYKVGRVCSDSGHDIVNGRPTGKENKIKYLKLGLIYY